jgi:hypothetical protein
MIKLSRMHKALGSNFSTEKNNKIKGKKPQTFFSPCISIYSKTAGHRWLIPVILGTREAEIRRIAV